MEQDDAKRAKGIIEDMKAERLAIGGSIQQFRDYDAKAFGDLTDFYNSLNMKAKFIERKYQSDEVQRFIKNGSAAFVRNRRHFDFFDKLKDFVSQENLEDALKVVDMRQEVVEMRMSEDPVGLLNTVEDKLSNKWDGRMEHIGEILSPTKRQGESYKKQFAELSVDDWINKISVHFKSVRDLGAQNAPEVDTLLDDEDDIEVYVKDVLDLAHYANVKTYFYRMALLSYAEAMKLQKEELKKDKERKEEVKIEIAGFEEERDGVKEEVRVLGLSKDTLISEIEALNKEKERLIQQIQNGQQILLTYASKVPDGAAPTSPTGAKPGKADAPETPDSEEETGAGSEGEEDDEGEGGESDKQAESKTPSEALGVASKSGKSLKPRAGYIAFKGEYYSIQPNKFGRHTKLDVKGHLGGTISEKEYGVIMQAKKEEELMEK